MANQIRYQVGFDIQKQGLNELKQIGFISTIAQL